ncbi:hypothetical protein AgCh_001196 [Apium graveolens]
MDKAWISVDKDSLHYEIGVEKFLIFAEENCKDSEEVKKFLADAEKPLFEGRDSSTLDSMFNLHNWKARLGISDSAFTDLLSSVGSLLPKDHVLLSNAYTAKKTLSVLGLEYIKIHACPNECILYRGINSDFVECPKCHISRWKLGKDGKVRVNVPDKVICYFPIIPRFKRLFKSKSTAELLTWHANQKSQDGQMRHPADSPSWRNVDYKWPEFGNEPRNLRLAMAADGINPHKNGMNNRYSCWPVVLTTYNLPPWLCMKRKFLMLTILVSGSQEPGNNIDVFLQPLIDDLKKLWKEGEPDVYDAHTKSSFTLRAILMWIINDFPAYGNLSGCVNKGYMCCPVCCDDIVAKYLPYTKKICFQGHRRYLPRNHPYRRKKTDFNEVQELGNARQILSGEEVHHVRHCLDIMHIEKNMCDNLIGALLNMKFKTKDSEASRLDMVEMGIRTDLAPQKVGARRMYQPPAAYTLSKEEKRKPLKSLSSMKLPYGHSSNIKNFVSMPDMKFFGLKSHDCHILLQQLLQVAIRGILPKNVREFVKLYIGKKKLSKPPPNYAYVDKDCWRIFVAVRTSKSWEKISKVQNERVSERKYPHRTSRKEYIGLEEDEKRKGEFVPSGSEDVLSVALETPEHSGRVRGVGSFVNPSTYFNLPKGKDKKSRVSKEEFEQTKNDFEKRNEDLMLQIAELKNAMKEMASVAKLHSPMLSDKASCRVEEKEGVAEMKQKYTYCCT